MRENDDERAEKTKSEDGVHVVLESAPYTPSERKRGTFL